MDYLNALKAKILELQGRNQRIAVHLSPAKEARGEAGDESTPAYQHIELRVTVSKNECDMVDLVFHLLEFLKQMEEKMSIVSMQADTELHHMNQFNQAIFRLKIKVWFLTWTFWKLLLVERWKLEINVEWMIMNI